MSFSAFNDILQGPFAQYLQYSRKIGGDVAQHSQLVERAFHTQLQFLQIASQSAKPANQNDLMNLLKPTSDSIMAIQEFREKNRTSPFFNHLSAVSESIPALGWVTVSPAPAPYVKEMNDAGQFYTNRVLKDWKEKDKTHVEWVKALIQILTELQAFVKQHHTTGLVWSGKGAAPRGGVPPPPPGAPAPPPPMNLSASADPGVDRSALFAQLNQGAEVTSHLKKVTPDMQTHKNPALKNPSAVSVKGSGSTNNAFGSQPDKPPKFAREGKKWVIEFQKGNHQLVVEDAEMNNVVYLYKCVDSTVIVKGKINSIVVDACKKTAVVCDYLVATIEFINCQSVQMQHRCH
ncbi:unnamed protein product [Acanthoscelides obtectus]|uniref:C-CAP/cofactor C-like domain-containing protein n=1 Tax=Acanthoscelides obtectus TaxID=200917 RepID=A0A9P0JZQ8_ACAOB|nr:unnamed protein product [Acanthoscelides obtectus]CAK1628781.1 Adenylyl cyclase-associated protein 1 [Acanthoscelides obtectus]